MAVETEKRSSGIWTVLYQPDTPPRTIDKFQQMFNYLGRVLITDVDFNIMSRANLACLFATAAYVKPINQFLNEQYGFNVDQAFLLFNEDVGGPRNTQTGQSVLKITEEGVLSPFSIIDPAWYLFRIRYRSMPIAVGGHDFIERAMGEIYSNAVGKTIKTKLLLQ